MSKIFNVNIIDVYKILKEDRRKTAAFSFVAGTIGVVLAFATPKIYKSTVTLAPEDSGSSISNSISSMAAMVGMTMKLGQSGDALYPEIYPDLMQSTDFIVGLFPIKVTTSTTNQTYEYYEYLLHHQKSAFYEYPKIKLVEWIQKLTEEKSTKAKGASVNPFRLTRQEADIASNISNNISCQVDKKTNVISITVTDQDPVIAATIADSVKQHLQLAITNYRTQKARTDLEYIESLFEEARKQYDKARQTYAAYADANQEVTLQAYKMKEEDLENDMQLKYNIYQQVVEQLQLAKAKVQERTPAFTIIQSASVPVKHSSRPKIVSLLIWMILGFIIRCVILAWKNKKLFVFSN